MPIESCPREQSTLLLPASVLEVEVCAVDPRVEDADVDARAACLDGVRLRRLDLLHAPLRPLERICRLLGTAVGNSPRPLEVLPDLFDDRVRPYQVGEERVRRVDGKNADLGEQIVCDRASSCLDERDRVVVGNGVVAVDRITAEDRVVAEHRVRALDGIGAVDGVVAREDDQMPLRLAGTRTTCSRGAPDEQDDREEHPGQSVSLEHLSSLPSR